jgi:hypothetical protein
MDALVMLAVVIFADAMDALVIVATSMIALEIVAVPVKVAFSMGAFSRFSWSYDALRSVISWLMVAVKFARCATMSEFVAPLPMVTLVINVQL